MYKVWDDFGITQSRMLGYWHSKNPVKTDNDNVLVTVYLKKDSALLCFYNFSQKTEKFAVDINEKLLGFVPKFSTQIKFGKNCKKNNNMKKTFTLKKRNGIMVELRS